MVAPPLHTRAAAQHRRPKGRNSQPNTSPAISACLLYTSELGRMLGLEKSQVMACGDSENDLAMLEAVGLGVAMGNAPLAIQQKAAAVTATNDEDGVALALEKYVLGR